MAKFMALGYWERHVRRMRIIYQKKHAAMLAAIERSFGNRALVVGQGAGLHVVMQLQGESSGEAEIIRTAAQHGINLFPFSATCAAGVSATTSLLLGFGGMTAAEIGQGIEKLSRITGNM
jgi:GntR family transcriptional regulator/MocR family aminotransferase